MSNPTRSKSRNRGEANANAKLTADDVREMRHLHNRGVSAYRLAKMFKTNHRTAWMAVTGRTWKHVPMSVHEGGR